MSWSIEFNLGVPISLTCLAAANGGGAANLPATFPGASGIYLILNQSLATENRYMGVTMDIRTRFRQRMACVFELGITQAQLSSAFAFLGNVQFYDDTVPAVIYNPSYLTIVAQINGVNVDFEHLFIRMVMYTFPFGTITNTQKTGVFTNPIGDVLNVDLNWLTAGAPPGNSHIALAIGGAI